MQFLTGFSFLTKRTNLEQNDSWAVWIGANFEQQHCCARCFGQVLALYKMSPISSKATVAQSVFTQILSKRAIAHGVLHKFKLFNKRHQFWLTGQLRTQFLTGFIFLTVRPNLEQNERCAVWLRGNFEQQHGCARCFLQVLSKTANQSFLDIIVHLHQLR